MPTLQEMLRLQNMFGAPMGNMIPPTGPSNLSTPPIMDPAKDPYANISFGPTDMTKQPTDNSNTSISGVNGNEDDSSFTTRRMQEIYQPHTENIGRLNDMIDTYPQRKNYEPSIMRRIGAALTMFGQGGPDMAKNVMDAPFNNALADWKNKVQPIEQAANLERYQNTNERTAAYQTVANELRQRAQDLKAKNDEANAKIREHRASVYEYKSTHPGMKLIFTKGGNVQAFDPASGKTLDTGIPTGSMTEMDKLNLQEEQRQADIESRGNESRKTEGIKEENRQSDIASRGVESRRTKEVVPGGSKGGVNKPETPTQTRVRQFNAARELLNSRPDLRPFIKLGSPSNNDFTVTPPGESRIWGHTGPTAEQYKQIQDKIYGATAPIPASSHGPTNTPVAPTGRIVIKDKSGKAVGTIPAEQKAQAIQQGYLVD